MKRLWMLFLMSVLLIHAILGCGIFDALPNNETHYTIVFNTQGGGTIDSIYVEKNTKTPLPTPSKEGDVFIGWYRENVYLNLFTEDDYVTSNLQLYAKWQANVYQLLFDTRGGNALSSIELNFGDLIILPDPPTKEEATFGGWYVDSTLLQPLDFTTMPAEDFTLYARWVYEHEDPFDFLASNPSSVLQSFEAFVNYLDYMLFNRLLEATVTFAYSIDNISEEIDQAFKAKHIQSNASMQFSYQPDTQTLSITATFNDEAYLSASNTSVYEQRPFYFDTNPSSRDASFENFSINSIDKTYPVITSDQLYYVMEKGYRPIFTEEDTVAEAMYEAAKSVLREIVDDSMSDMEKLRVIYAWLVNNITYDGDLLTKLIEGEENLSRYKGFFLEGVFIDGRAVCDGFSKAFLVMTRLEGIHSIRVIGKSINPSVTALHAWNKVYLGENWYVIDTTSANTLSAGTEIFSHAFFMIDDDTMENHYIATSNLDVIAEGIYDIYSSLSFTYNTEGYSRVIESQEELNAVFSYYMTLNEPTLSLDIRIGDSYADTFFNSTSVSLQAALTASGMTSVGYMFIGDVMIFWQSSLS